MQITIKPNGLIISLYSETLDFTVFGHPYIRRASHIEPDEQGRWIADMTPVRGPTLGPFRKRSEALDAELQWLNLMLSESEFNEQL